MGKFKTIDASGPRMRAAYKAAQEVAGDRSRPNSERYRAAAAILVRNLPEGSVVPGAILHFEATTPGESDQLGDVAGRMFAFAVGLRREGYLSLVIDDGSTHLYRVLKYVADGDNHYAEIDSFEPAVQV